MNSRKIYESAKYHEFDFLISRSRAQRTPTRICVRSNTRDSQISNIGECSQTVLARAQDVSFIYEPRKNSPSWILQPTAYLRCTVDIFEYSFLSKIMMPTYVENVRNLFNSCQAVYRILYFVRYMNNILTLFFFKKY